MQTCSRILFKVIAFLVCILIALVIVDFQYFRRRKVVQVISKNDEVRQTDDTRSPDDYLREECPQQLYKIFKSIKLLLFYELEWRYAEEYKGERETKKHYRHEISRKINKKYVRLFRLIKDLQFDFTRRRLNYLTRSLNLYLKNSVVKQGDEEEREAVLHVQKKMIHEIGSLYLRVLFTHEDYTREYATMYIKTRHNLREIYQIMNSFQRKPKKLFHLGHREHGQPCSAIPRVDNQNSRSNYDFSRSDLNHTRLTDEMLATKKPATQPANNVRRVRDTSNHTFTSGLNGSRTWRTIDFFRHKDSGFGHLEDLYPDYFLSKRPITSIDQIPTAPEDVVLNLQENPDRWGYTRKGLLQRWRSNLNMTDEEFEYAVKTFRGNKTDAEHQKDYEEQLEIFLNSFEAELKRHNINDTIRDPPMITQKKKIRMGTPPLALTRAPNATRRFFNGSRPANFSRWTKKKNSTPLVRTKFIKTKKTTKPPNNRKRRQATTEISPKYTRTTKTPTIFNLRGDDSVYVRLTRTTPKPYTGFVYGKKFNKLLPERYRNPDVLTISEENPKNRGRARKQPTTWNFLNYVGLRTTGLYNEEPDTAEIANQWRRRFVLRRQYDSVTYYDWNNFVANETGKSKYEKSRPDNWGLPPETTTMSDSEYLRTHSMSQEFLPAQFDFNEQEFHKLMYESFYDLAGYTTAPVWFNSTKKTKHPRKLKLTSPSTPATHAPNTTINFVKLLIKLKLKEYAKSTQRTITTATFPHYIFNQSYITKFNDLFHHFEYAKAGKDLVNGTNQELEKNVENLHQYFRDFGDHVGEIEKAMERNLKISLDPDDREERTKGFVRYAQGTATPNFFREKFNISSVPPTEFLTFRTPSSAEFDGKTVNPFLQDFLEFEKQIKTFEKDMAGNKGKEKFMEIINRGREGDARYNSSEVAKLMQENGGHDDKEGVKIEEVSEKTTSKKRTSKKAKNEAFVEDSFYKDDDSGDLRNNVRKQNLRQAAARVTGDEDDDKSIPSDELAEIEKEWLRPRLEWEGNVTYRKNNRYQCVECDQNQSTYWRSSNFSEYADHYRVHHFDMYNRSKFTEDLAWKLGYDNPYKCLHCDFYEPFDNDVCYDHYEKDHPEHDSLDMYAHVFKMRKFYLNLRKQWPHNDSQELKSHVADLFGTPKFAGGTTECTACQFHHPTPRDPVFYSQFYVLPTTDASDEDYEQLLGNRSEPLPSNETRIRVPKWLQRDCDKYRGMPHPSGELLKNLSRGIFNSRSGENDTSEFKSDYYPSCDYRSKTLETGEDPFGSSCEDRMDIIR